MRTKTLLSMGILGLVFASAGAAFGQAPPAITYDEPSFGFRLPTSGELSYGASLGGSYFINGAANSSEQTSVFGNAFVGVATDSEVHPTSLLYSGGIDTTIHQSNVYYYQGLSASTSYRTENWNFGVSDDFRVLQDAAWGGASGAAGVGDLGVGTAGGTQTLPFSPGATRITENVAGSASRLLTGKTSLNLSGGYQLFRYLDDTESRFDSSSYSGTGGVTHQLDARQSISGTFGYFHSSQPGFQDNVDSDSATVGYNRQLSARTSISASGGPQYIISNYAGTSASELTYAYNGAVVYSGTFANFSAQAARGLQTPQQAGAGIETTSAGASAVKMFAVVWNAAVSLNYLHTAGIVNSANAGTTTDGEGVAAQVNRSFGRVWSAYVSYTLEKQVVSGTFLVAQPLSGLIQGVSFGVTYAPRPLHLHAH